MTPDILRTAGEALHGADFRAALAVDLAVSHSTVKKWLTEPGPKTHRGMPPGLRAELVRLLRAKAAAVTALADEIAAGIGDLHGLTRREVQAIGWAMSGEWLTDETFPSGWTARRLTDRMREEIDTMRMDEGEAVRLFEALHRLTDGQARDVLQAARDLDELVGPIVDD